MTDQPPKLTPKRAIPRQGTSYMAFTAAPPDPDDPLLGFAPVPHKQLRRNSITPAKQRAFIAELAATGVVTQAALSIGCSLEAIYRLRNKAGAEGFRAAWEAALDRGVGRLEDCALARALEGEERMVVSAGKLLGTERRHNEALVMFLLRQRRGERYGSEIRPGHPLYERIRREVLDGHRAASLRDEEEIYASINAKLDLMRARQEAVKALLLEDRSD